ncbi:MAG: GNAT family N-acetyltransferase [Candidatus Omnitrophica bacterium]|nr:GNAT family N-acetyltransferase [Candidatus Omnitrophota bacterium]
MDNKYIIEQLNSNEVEKIAQLYTISFGRAAYANTFRWKYFENPIGEPVSLGIKEKGDLIGALTIVPEEFYVFGQKHTIYKCIDLMIHPEHRGGWLASRLFTLLSKRLKQDKVLFMYSICARHTTLFFLRCKWKKLDEMKYYFKHKIQFKVKFLFKNLDQLYKKGVLKEIKSVSELCENYKFKIDTTKIHIVKDEKYFSWRLKDPRFKYTIIGYYESGSLKGYIIYNTGTANNTYIADLEADNDDKRIIKLLLDAAEFAAHKLNCKSIITLAVTGSLFQRFIKQNGYICNPFNKGPLTSKIDFDVLAGDVYKDRLLDKSNWHIYPFNYDAI